MALDLGFRFDLFLLSGGVLFWTAGFDLLYALQDEEFDRQQGLKSIPAILGGRSARILSRLSFALGLVLWVIMGWRLELKWPYFAGLVLIAYILTLQHWMLLKDLKRLNFAFFNLNASVGLIFLFSVLCSVYF